MSLADANFPAIFRICACHERRCAFILYGQESNPGLLNPERFLVHTSAVALESEHHGYPGSSQDARENIVGRHGQIQFLLFWNFFSQALDLKTHDRFLK